MKTHLIVLAITLSTLVLLAAAQANAQSVNGVRIVIDSLEEAIGATDDVYFVLGGGSSRGTVGFPVIGAPNQDGFNVQIGQKTSSIVLLEGMLSPGERGFYTLMLRKHNGASYATISANVGTAIGGVGATFVNTTTTVPQLLSAATQFANIVSQDVDKTLGVWAVDVHMPSPFPQALATGTALPGNNGSSVSVLSVVYSQIQTGSTTFSIVTSGSGETFLLQTHVETFSGTRLENVNSHMCLDVPSWSPLDGVQLQQYPCNNGANQQWLLLPGPLGTKVIVNVNSGKCADIRDASPTNGAAVQQFTCHGGTNQMFLPWPTRYGDYLEYTAYVYQNVNSGKCIDVPNGSTLSSIPLTQYTCWNPYSLNQMWNPIDLTKRTL
jgi:ricin-type beta-trefoil lectin protein